jgi:transcriptional regulator with XRE-family HTH domain
MAKPSTPHAKNSSLIALGTAIKNERKKRGVSQEALALSAGIDRSYLGGVERGEHNIAVINLIRLTKALDIKLYELAQEANL